MAKKHQGHIAGSKSRDEAQRSSSAPAHLPRPTPVAQSGATVGKRCAVLASHLLSGDVASAELHGLVLNLTAAGAESHGGDKRRDHDDILELHWFSPDTYSAI